MTTHRCPACGADVLRPAAEGGVVLLSRIARLEPDGTIVLRCPQAGCGAEMELYTRTVPRLRLRTRLTAPDAASRLDVAK